MNSMRVKFCLVLLTGVLLSSCGASVPRIRDVSEEPIEGNYWHQRFTLYQPANRDRDCQISRTGQKLDLNSPAELVDVWRKSCSTTTDHDARSDR
jgi:hypothetical protein